ncbi:hypothetical protein BDV93DRAFT_525064 [Ceratobasidium sp. AG-I]|nr:hypothetical protein BDV93DRAFT_525064 [Ceratobasidium sp. AG-I]
MSSLENSNNNQGPVLDTSTARQNFTRDTKYYYHDGSKVFLVGGVLFKFQASIIIPSKVEEPDYEEPDYEETYEFEPIMKPLHDPLSPPAPNGEGSSDVNPIIIPGVEAEQFRDLLLVLLGRPDDWDYMAFLEGRQYGNHHSRDILVRFADLSSLASRFGMIGLWRWGLRKISSLLGSLDLANYAWDKNILCKMLSCLDNRVCTDEASKSIDFILTILSMSIDNPAIPQNRVNSILDTCVHWYKDLAMSPQSKYFNRIAFGYVFALILSLGHRSAIWTDRLNREDRLMLYTAQAHLTCLQRDKSLDLDWLVVPRTYLLEYVCSTCNKKFDSAWDASFGVYLPLDSAIPLEDISKLVHLPKYRQTFAKAVRSEAWTLHCEHKDFQCGEQILEAVDSYTCLSFVSLSDKYQYFVTSA